LDDRPRHWIADLAAEGPVLYDDVGAIIGLAGTCGTVGGADTSAGPAVVVPANTPLAAVLQSAEILEALLDGAAGLVVVDDDGRPVGVVPTVRIQRELGREMAAPHEMGDAQPLGQRHVLPPPIRIQCGVCRRTNEFTRLRQAATQRCQHGDHDFVASYQAG